MDVYADDKKFTRSSNSLYRQTVQLHCSADLILEQLLWPDKLLANVHFEDIKKTQLHCKFQITFTKQILTGWLCALIQFTCRTTAKPHSMLTLYKSCLNRFMFVLSNTHSPWYIFICTFLMFLTGRVRISHTHTFISFITFVVIFY